MDYDVISEELKDCCSIAASSTGCYSAFGIGEDVLPRMEIAESYGEPLNRSLFAAFYDSEQQLVASILAAAGYSWTGPQVQRPLYNLELMISWSHQLYTVCRKRSVTSWSASLTNLRQHFNNKAKPAPSEDVVRIVGKPRECSSQVSLRASVPEGLRWAQTAGRSRARPSPPCQASTSCWS